MPSKIDQLVLAIGDTQGCFSPGTKSFDLCNPLMIRSFAAPGKHLTDENGVRVFPSLISGLKAGFFDCSLKVSGKSRAGLKPTDKIVNLLRVYGIVEPGGVSKVISFLRRALKDQSVSKDTELRYFLEPNKDTECPTPQPTTL